MELKVVIFFLCLVMVHGQWRQGPQQGNPQQGNPQQGGRGLWPQQGNPQQGGRGQWPQQGNPQQGGRGQWPQQGNPQQGGRGQFGPQRPVPPGRGPFGPVDPRFQPVQPSSTCCDRNLYGGNTGTTPLPMPKHCMDIREFGGVRDGVYTIYVSSVNECGKKDVYCDQTRNGGGWTVIQRRIDGRLNFVRNWEEYKHGFGFLEGEFWLGNEWIHKIAMQGPHELRVDLGDFQMQERFARYKVFSVSDEMGNYTLRVERYDPQSNAGDALTGHNNVPFSTIDRDNDRWSGNCARQYTGAWWYTSCHNSNLNGAYLRGPNRQYARGVVWNQWRGYSYSLRFTEMKIRPLF
ncbi:ficolin-2-like [Lytechinus pictus]|uniref:ficolin-2-like n=1 Tax=Lytechinus pictus TaxID=7653 RepID=UPI0030BA0282